MSVNFVTLFGIDLPVTIKILTQWECMHYLICQIWVERAIVKADINYYYGGSN